MEGGLARELALDAGADHPDAEAWRRRRLRGQRAAPGGARAAPPSSVQPRIRLRACNSQFTSTRPDITDNEPYLAALVESSCSASASVWAVRGSSDTSGPAAVIRSGASAR